MNKWSLGRMGLFFGLLSLIIMVGCSHDHHHDHDHDNDDVIFIDNIFDDVETKTGSLQIVTTFPPLASHVANLLDDNDTLVNLVPPGTSVHFRQPTPQDVLAMQEADVIFINGLHLEEFLEPYFENLMQQWVLIVDTSKDAFVREFDGHDAHTDEHRLDEHDDTDHGHHHHEWPDPHIWLDIDNAIVQTQTIADALSALDPTQATYYAEQANTYIQTLAALDQEIRDMIGQSEISPFVVFHDAYQYFLHAYDIVDKQVAMIQEFHGDNPSQKEIADLLTTIQDNNVTTLFVEPQFNPRIVLALQEQVDVDIREIDPIGSDLDTQGYINTMRRLASAFSQQ